MLQLDDVPSFLPAASCRPGSAVRLCRPLRTCSELFDGLDGTAAELSHWTEMPQSPASLLPSLPALSPRPACQGCGCLLESRPEPQAPPPPLPVEDPRSTDCWAYRSTSRKSSEPSSPMLPGALGRPRAVPPQPALDPEGPPPVEPSPQESACSSCRRSSCSRSSTSFPRRPRSRLPGPLSEPLSDDLSDGSPGPGSAVLPNIQSAGSAPSAGEAAAHDLRSVKPHRNGGTSPHYPSQEAWMSAVERQ